jgi:hypothetical protein
MFSSKSVTKLENLTVPLFTFLTLYFGYLVFVLAYRLFAAAKSSSLKMAVSQSGIKRGKKARFV